MPYIGKKPADIIATAVDTTTGTFSGAITSSAGATITTADNLAQLTLKSTDADAGSGPVLDLIRDSGSPADGDAVGQIKFTADNDAGEVTLFGDIITTVNDASNGTEDGSIFFRSLTAGSNSTIEMVGGGFKFADNAIISMGAGGDLTLASDGSNGTITSNGNFTLDVVSDIILDADTRNIKLQDGGTDWGRFTRDTTTSPTAFVIDAPSNNVAIKFKGNDGGSAITALHLDMSNDGHATFKNGVTLTDGNLVVANGHGIDFSAVSHASGMSSELLNTYEEGTWTPTLFNGSSNLTSASINATYTKIGRTVYAEFQIGRNDGASDTNVVQIGGLPFTSRAGPRLAGQAWVDNTSSDIKCYLYIGSSETSATLIKVGGNNSFVSFNEFDNGRFIYGAVVYNT